MKKIKKSKLLLSVDKIIDNYQIKTISLTLAQYTDLCDELYPFCKDEHLKNKEFVYKNRVIKIWNDDKKGA